MEGAALAAGVHGFPVVLTSFVGRGQAVREVAGLLETYRLVTVTGPGGVGKTRLADAVARRVAARFADGAWLAELAPVRDPAQVAVAVAAALGVREQLAASAAVAVERVLARLRRLIAVLAAVTCGLLGWAGAVPAASASIIPVPDGAYGPAPGAPGGTVHVIAVSGMPGWQITFIAVAAALAASAVAVLLDRARASRRTASATG